MIRLSVSVVEAVSALEKHLMLKAGLLVLTEMEIEICNALRNSRTPARSKNFKLQHFIKFHSNVSPCITIVIAWKSTNFAMS